MRFLLDTHVLLWLLDDDDRLGPITRRLIEDPNHIILVSIVSLWEIAIKKRIGKLKVDVQAAAASVEQSGTVLLNITPAHLAALLGLPTHHRDPFDHLLIAQAMVEGAILMSNDRNMPKYPAPLISCSG